MKHLFFALLLSISLSSFGQKCKGTTQKKQPCKLEAVDKDGYCRYHNPKAEHCTFIKKDGKRCKMIVKEKVLYCRYHVGGKVQRF